MKVIEVIFINEKKCQSKNDLYFREKDEEPARVRL